MASEESTTPDLAELVRQRTHALFRGEMDIDTFLGGLATDAVWDLTRQGRTLQGWTEIGAFVEEWLAGFENLEVTVAEARELGNGVVFAVFHQRGRPVGSSSFVQQRDCWVNVFEDGLIKRATVYQDIDEARAVAERLAEERE
jgi:ketosteroid isomerase-like protein